MKKWLMIGLVTLGVGTWVLGQAQTQTDTAAAGVAVTSKAAKTGKQAPAAKKSRATKQAAAAKKTAAAKQTKAAKKTVATARTKAAKKTAATEQTKATEQTVATKSRQATGLAAYYGKWRSTSVTITLTAKRLTVAQPGVAPITTGYRAVKQANGYVFIPAKAADPLFLTLKAGQLAWQTGASAPLTLTRVAR
ncbi:hypothetical protein [Lacticaseibacillus parakribbianus]|uniref:hypothetical protein n=1 Tax=Lacticaseibacillus parakribbianus TaxID=2970927 RepID=UPI0021CB3BB8|nr:hypothetical protein [Lacticaseibacillus parakribbianus]